MKINLRLNQKMKNLYPPCFDFFPYRELSDLVLGEQQSLELFFSAKKVENPLSVPIIVDVDDSVNIHECDKYITIDADDDDVDCNNMYNSSLGRSVDLPNSQDSNSNDMNINGYEELNIHLNRSKNEINNESKNKSKNNKNKSSTTSEMLTDYGSIRILRIRNPWGKREWQGNFAEKSEVWTGKMRKILDKGQLIFFFYWLHYDVFSFIVFYLFLI